MTYKDEATYGSLPPCRSSLTYELIPFCFPHQSNLLPRASARVLSVRNNSWNPPVSNPSTGNQRILIAAFIVVYIQYNASFGVGATIQPNGCLWGRNPTTQKLLVRSEWALKIWMGMARSCHISRYCMLQRVAACCSVLQYVVVWCGVLQKVNQIWMWMWRSCK